LSFRPFALAACLARVLVSHSAIAAFGSLIGFGSSSAVACALVCIKKGQGRGEHTSLSPAHGGAALSLVLHNVGLGHLELLWRG